MDQGLCVYNELVIMASKFVADIIICQCRDFPQSYVILPLAIATRNLFNNFLSLKSLLPFKIKNILVCLVFNVIA